MTVYRVWLKHYLFVLRNYPEFFSKILSKVHSEYFISIINNDIGDFSESQPLSNSNQKNSPPLSFMYFNARSLFNKKSLLSCYAATNHPDVIAITETWATPETPDGIYSLPGYNLYRADRHDKRGGGVMIYVKVTIVSSEVFITHSNGFESLCVNFSLTNGMKVGFLCVYRPPNISTTGDSQLISLLEKFLDCKFKHSIIVGDFNMSSVDWKTLSAPVKYSPFLKCLSNYFLRQHVTEPTRPNSKSILDLIFTTLGTNISNICVNECFGSSDHSILNFNVEFPYAVNSLYISKRDYNKANWNMFRHLLQNVDWNSIFIEDDIDVIWSKFKSVLINAKEASIPYKKRKSFQIKSNPKIRTALRYTRRCHVQLKNLQTNEALIRYVCAKKIFKNLLIIKHNRMSSV